MTPTYIFVGSKAAYGRFQREYALANESIRHVSEASQLRGMGKVTILHDRREVAKEEKWHLLLVRALEHNAHYDPYSVDAANKQAAAYEARYSPLRGLQGYSKGKHPQKKQPSQQMFGYTISTQNNTSSVWLDSKIVLNQQVHRPSTWTVGNVPITKEMVDGLFGMPKQKPEPEFTCMWCAAEFQTEEELDLHENGCDG